MKKLAAFLLVFSLFMSLGCISAIAAQEQGSQPRREDMRAHYAEIEKKFDGLTDAQKEQIYSQNDQVLSEMKKLIQMYVDSGVLSKEESDRIIQNMTNRNAKAQQEGKVGFPIPHRGNSPQKAS